MTTAPTAQPSEPQLLRPSEVCRRLAIDNETMHKMIERGDLKAVRLGPKSTRVYADSLEELLKKGSTDD